MFRALFKDKASWGEERIKKSETKNTKEGQMQKEGKNAGGWVAHEPPAA